MINNHDLFSPSQCTEGRHKHRQALLIEKALQRKPATPSKIEVVHVQLPLWPESIRGVPNGILRSALFGVFGKGNRRYVERERIATLEGIEIHYTGQRLDQGDLDLWESVLHIARFNKMGEKCRFTAYFMLKQLGKTDTGKNREILHKRFLRLKANAVEVKQGNFTYIGSLIDEAFKDANTQEYVVVLNAKLRPLFAVDQYTYIEWAIRKALVGKPLAQWLHGFYSSHARSFPYKIETLHRLCGSNAVRLDHFRQELIKALDAVVSASKSNGQVYKYDIQGELVKVNACRSKSQKRHLIRKGEKKTNRPNRYRFSAGGIPF
jgi:hypothetical protein